jgi:hypothetical protein
LFSPGGTVEAEIKILPVDFFAKQTDRKNGFEFHEGSTIIEQEKIKHILIKNSKKAR